MNFNDTSLDGRLIGLVGQLLGRSEPFPQPFPTQQRLSELGVTSLKMVNLMLAIEQEFNILIPQADITPENFESLATIRSLVERCLASRGTA